MALIVIPAERMARELARSEAAERAMAAERRRLGRLLAVMVLAVIGEIFFLGMGMALTGDAAIIAQSVGMLCGIAPLFIIVFDQLRRDD